MRKRTVSLLLVAMLSAICIQVPARAAQPKKVKVHHLVIKILDRAKPADLEATLRTYGWCVINERNSSFQRGFNGSVYYEVTYTCADEGTRGSPGFKLRIQIQKGWSFIQLQGDWHPSADGRSGQWSTRETDVNGMKLLRLSTDVRPNGPFDSNTEMDIGVE